jgi:hypothetical protein
MSFSAASYGVNESNPLLDGASYHSSVDHTRDWSLREVSDAGGKITRVRVLREGLHADISYIHATVPGVGNVPVSLNGAYYFHTGNYFSMKREFIEWAKKEGVFAKGLGLLDNWSVLA